jgi:hypothetical protein
MAKPYSVTVSNHYPGASTSTSTDYFRDLELEAVAQTLEQSPLGACHRFAELLRSVGTRP